MNRHFFILLAASLGLIFPTALKAQTNPVPAKTEAAAEPATEPAATEPFAFADFTWVNGNSRQTTSVLDSKMFTGEVLADTNYIYDFNHPKDHTLVGSTSAGRTSEFQLQQLGVGGDFHYENARARVMTQFGMYSTMTPRNDASPARGQWDLADAYRYVSEAYGGYHWDVLHGINLDAGIFMSYIGLFSYYNVENWAYQASYTSANTPWFFNGLRLQIFPTDRLKTEFWLINGWQSYGQFNEQPGLGFQILYRPTENTSFVSNGYYGTDTLNNLGRSRYHSDSSYQLKYYDNKSAALSKAAMSLTFDIGCEDGGGVKCWGGDSGGDPSQYFLSAMAYNRIWFGHDKHAFTIGGGFMTNPGRYLVLLPPVQQPSTAGTPGGAQGGATASNNPSCPGCFTENRGDHFNAWDFTVGYDYMPNQFVTFRGEVNHRAADVNYFAGANGVTSPDGTNNNNTNQSQVGWTPDLVQAETRMNFAMLVRF